VAAEFLKSFILISYITLPGILFCSCSEEGPIEQEKMVRIYCELLIAQDSLASASTLKPAGIGREPLTDSIKSAIFRRYNVTPEDYKETIDYYNEDQKLWESFFSRTIDYLDSLKTKSAKQIFRNH